MNVVGKPRYADAGKVRLGMGLWEAKCVFLICSLLAFMYTLLG